MTSSSRTDPPGWMIGARPPPRQVRTVGEREERVRRQRRALSATPPATSSAPCAPSRRGSSAPRRSPRRQSRANRIALDLNVPRARQAVRGRSARLVGARGVATLPVRQVLRAARGRLLGQGPARTRSPRARRSAPARPLVRTRRRFFFSEEVRKRASAIQRRDQHLEERGGQQLRQPLVDLEVEGDDAAERAGRVVSERPPVRVQPRPPIATPHGLLCLTIAHAGRPNSHEPPRRVQIEQVVERELLAVMLAHHRSRWVRAPTCA